MTDDEIRKLAREMYRDPATADIDFDDNATVSRSAAGAYVQAWVFVPLLEDGPDWVCECCLRGDLTLHSCPNADCGQMLCQDCLGIHDCGPTDPGNPPSLEGPPPPHPPLGSEPPCCECGSLDHDCQHCPVFGEDELLDPDYPCPECHGEVGHRVNCSHGIAFSDYNKYPGDVAARDTF